MPDSPSVLIVGGSHAEIPLIDAVHTLGYQAVTTGNRASDIGHSVSDRYVACDYSDPKAIRDLAQQLGVFGIVSGCNDLAAISTAFAAEELGLPGHDSTEKCLRLHHKDRFRNLLSEFGLPSPKSTVVHKVVEAEVLCQSLRFPVIVKPVDLTGGKGISVCGKLDEVEAAVTKAFSITRQNHVIVEEFIEGSRHGFTCFVSAGNVGFWFADDEQYFLNPFLVSGTTTPSGLPPDAIEELRSTVEEIVRGLCLVDGLIHIQCILSSNGPVIVELCRRCPGDLYPWFVKLSSGFDYASSVVRAELGLPFENSPQSGVPIARHCLMSASNGLVTSVKVPKSLEQRAIEKMVWSKFPHEMTNHLVEKLGILFFAFDDCRQMQEVVPFLSKDIQIEVSQSQEQSVTASEDP